MKPDHTPIESLAQHVGQQVTLRGWLYNKRSSKGLHFLVLRDGRQASLGNFAQIV